MGLYPGGIKTGGIKTGRIEVGFYGNVFTKGQRRSITVRHNNVIERPRDKMDNANRFRTSKYHRKVPTWKYLLISTFENLTIFNGLHRIKKEIFYGIFLSLMLTVVDCWVFSMNGFQDDVLNRLGLSLCHVTIL